MKKQTINFSWPATLSDFTQDTVNENFSRGKLKVFYKGETADKRCFSDEFAERVIKTLPYAPVVSSYDEEADDFVGHADEQQIFGIVDPCVEPVFEVCEDDGKTWCICDVVLYTERPDTTGKLASKIIGQPHSLELNPKTVKYNINYDEKKHFKNIEFTAGDFIGVSVLGKKQKPAFTGSAFFSCDERFEAKMNILREYCENAMANEGNNGGEKMNLQEFMTLSWGEVSSKVESAICKEYQNDAYTYVVDMYPEYAIARFYYYVESNSKLMKIYYTCDDNGNITLGDIKEVHVVYEEVEDQVALDPNMKQIDEISIDAVSLAEDQNISETNENENVETTTAEDNTNNDDSEVNVDYSNESDQNDINGGDIVVEDSDVTTTTDEVIVMKTEPAQVLDVTITPQMEASVEDEQNTNTNNQETTSSSTTLTESERQEFEALKRERKVNLLNSYKDYLTDDEYNNFFKSIDSFSDESLELALLKAYKRNQQADTNSEKQIRAFAFAPINNASNESSLDAFVSKYKK